MRRRLGALVLVVVLAVACTSAEEAAFEPVNARTLPFLVIGAGQSGS